MTWKDREIESRPKRMGAIIGLAGVARSGKDSVGGFLVKEHNFVRISFATPVYNGLYALNPIVTFRTAYRDGYLIDVEPVRIQEIVGDIGWEKAKVEYEEVRKLLQRYGTEAGRNIHGQDCWVRLACEAINSAPSTNFVITDVRFENEVSALKNLGGRIVQINRPGFEPVNSHISDKPLPSYLFDEFIENSGTLEDLRSRTALLTAVPA